MKSAPVIPSNLPREPLGAQCGDMVVARAWKYDGQAHWVVPGRYLGHDEHGHWIYQPAGSLVSRPGHGHWAQTDALCLIPRSGYWVGTLYDDPLEDYRIYLDLAAQIGWRELARGGWEVNSIDMDLDVIESRSRGVFLDDEDEFAQHTESMHYPKHLVSALRNQATFLLSMVGQGQPPFDQTMNNWFTRGRAASTDATSR